MAATEMKPETLTFILDWIREGPVHQERVWEAADTKTVQLLSVASVVLGLAGVAVFRGVGAASSSAALILFGLAMCAYVVVGTACVAAIWGRTIHRSFLGDWLWPNSWDDDVSVVKHTLVAAVTEAYTHNKRILDQKANFMRLAVAGLACESTLVAAGLIVSQLAV